MRTIAQSFALIKRKLQNSTDHLQQYSSRKDLVAGNDLALKEISILENQLMVLEASFQSGEERRDVMHKVWNDHLLRLYLFMSLKGHSSNVFGWVIQQPIDMLITPFEAFINCDILPNDWSLDYYSFEERMAMIDKIETKRTRIEQQIQTDLVSTQNQIDSLITKSIEREIKHRQANKAKSC